MPAIMEIRRIQKTNFSNTSARGHGQFYVRP